MMIKIIRKDIARYKQLNTSTYFIYNTFTITKNSAQPLYRVVLVN